MLPIHTVLVATDFSDAAASALDYAADLTAALSRPLLIAHVYAPPPVVATDGLIAPIPFNEDELKASLARDLATAADRARQRGVAEVATVLTDGPTVDALLQVITDRGCDLVVAATHGRGGVKRLLLGSVADQLVRKAPCPVLMVGPRA